MKIFFDGRDFDSKEAIHGEFLEKLDFPLYYGRNLDALHDCLTDISKPTELYLYNFAEAEKKLGSYAQKLRRVLEDSEKENPSLRIFFFIGALEIIF